MDKYTRKRWSVLICCVLHGSGFNALGSFIDEAKFGHQSHQTSILQLSLQLILQEVRLAIIAEAGSISAVCILAK